MPLDIETTDRLKAIMARSRPHRTMRGKPASDTRFWASFGVAVALFLQVVFPTHVMAMSRGGETVFVMCSGDGLNATPVVDYNFAATLKAEDSTKTQGLKCTDCVFANLTAIVVHDTTRYDAVQYPPVAVLQPVKRDHERPQSQAPPRPHSCGPPEHI